MRKLSGILQQTLIIVFCLGAALLLAWKLLAVVDYGYGFWYDPLEIKNHIERYAPQNRQGKPGFENTKRPEHEALFHKISVAVNNNGAGLRELSYTSAAKTTLLLTDAEATHLEDVAQLIAVLTPFGWLCVGGFVLLLALSRWRRTALPGIGKSLITLVALAAIIALIIVIFGADNIFSTLHVAVFPAENQWFFYYQDSLMTTLMKAPDIFFAIGILWALLAAVIFVLASFAMRFIAAAR